MSNYTMIPDKVLIMEQEQRIADLERQLAEAKDNINRLYKALYDMRWHIAATYDHRNEMEGTEEVMKAADKALTENQERGDE